MLAVDDDGIGVAVDVADEGKEQSVEGRPQAHPDAGPEDERRALEPGHGIGSGQREAADNALDDDAVLPSPEAKGQGGGQADPADAEPGQVLEVEGPLAHAVLLRPVPLVTLGEEEVVDLLVAGQRLESLDPIMRAEVRDEGDPQPAASDGLSASSA